MVGLPGRPWISSLLLGLVKHLCFPEKGVHEVGKVGRIFTNHP